MNKKYIVVLIILLVLIGALSASLIIDNKKIKVPDFTGKNKEDVEEWCTSLKTNPCNINDDYSDEIALNNVIFQSIKANEILEDSITITISKGKKPIIKQFEIKDNTVIDDVMNWANKNNLTNVKYHQEYNDDKEKNQVIKIEYKDQEISEDTLIDVYISNGKDPNSNSVIEVVKGAYVGKTLEDFKTIVSKLKLEANHILERDAYSDTISKGDIVWHGSGIYEPNEKISYGVSLGKSSDPLLIKSGTYVGLSEQDFISKAKELGLKPNHNKERDVTDNTLVNGTIVWHGYGQYEKNEIFNYGLAISENKIVNRNEDITIKKDEYTNISESEFISKVAAIGLKAVKTEDHSDYSDSIAKDKVIWHGYGLFEKDETTIRYSLSKGQKIATRDKDITIKRNEYTNISEADFISKLATLGLKAVKTDDYSDYSDSIEKDKVIWHGYGLFEKDETTIRYSLSKGKKDGSSDNNEIVISYQQFANISESSFKEKVSALGLLPYHKTMHDDYSDSIPKGYIIWHGNTTYNKGDTINYGLSLGKKEVEPGQESVNITNNQFNNISESTFISNMKDLGLNVSKVTTNQSYSDTIAKDNIIWHQSGTFKKGATVQYSLSLGVKPIREIYLSTFSDIASLINKDSTFDTSKTNLTNYLNNAGFTNFTISGKKSNDSGAGVLISIKVDGQNHNLRKAYKENAQIEAVISTGLNN